jgi:hypothetical protein
VTYIIPDGEPTVSAFGIGIEKSFCSLIWSQQVRHLKLKCFLAFVAAKAHVYYIVRPSVIKVKLKMTHSDPAIGVVDSPFP